MIVQGVGKHFDIIGDVHGCADALVTLLAMLGYTKKGGCYRHQQRQAVFLGDLIDRGHGIRETLQIVSDMVESGAAYSLIGNHEYNAICYSAEPMSPALMSSSQGKGEPNVASEKVKADERYLSETLRAFDKHQSDWDNYVAWFRTLPIVADFESFRVVHACWDQAKVVKLWQENPQANFVNNRFFDKALTRGSDQNRIVERLLKGTNLSLPVGESMQCADGVVRNRFRTKFWCKNPQTYGEVLFQPDELPPHLYHRKLTQAERQQLVCYDGDQKPLFFGHYWRVGEPRLIADNLACLDYSAVRTGLLVSYRMDGERVLKDEKLVSVNTRCLP